MSDVGRDANEAGASDAGTAVLERLRAYVELESPTGDVARATQMAELLARDLEQAGAVVERLSAPDWGEHLDARIEGREADLPAVVLLGHLDTVHPVGTLAERPFRVVDGRAEGPGSFDMKAGLAVIVEALRRLAAAGRRPRRPVRILVSCDEEVGSRTSRAWIEDASRNAAACLVLEPSLPGGRVKTARKGVSQYRLRARGRAAHAGVDPERGINAIVELAAQIPRILALADSDRGTTVNIGTIHGGTAGNVVAAEAEAEVDVRFASPAEGQRVDAAMHALGPATAGAGLEVEGGINRPPLVRTEGVVTLYETARAAAAKLGFELGEGATGGGSDGSFVAALGVPTLDGLGPAGGGAHAVDEHVVVDDLPRRVALLERLLETL